MRPGTLSGTKATAVPRPTEAGGSEHIPRDPVEMEQMYVRAFKDPDGHVWEILHMDMG